jgi:hypothetical protein
MAYLNLMGCEVENGRQSPDDQLYGKPKVLFWCADDEMLVLRYEA